MRHREQRANERGMVGGWLCLVGGNSSTDKRRIQRNKFESDIVAIGNAILI